LESVSLLAPLLDQHLTQTFLQRLNRQLCKLQALLGRVELLL